MGGYDGLALAMYDTNDQSFSDKGADNFHSITIADGTTITSGYIQPFYASITTSGSITTASAQVNGFAVDLFLGGTISSEVEGMYVYITKSGTPTLTSANINGINIYIDELGGGSVISAIQLHKANTTAGTAVDAFIYCRLEGSGLATNLIEKGGTAANPEYFLTSNAADGMIAAYSASDAATKALRLKIAGTVYNIPMVPDSCS